jgi:membrane protein implicated in regulation of membrane protease activity
MSKRWATAIGGAVTFVAAGVGGVAGGKIWDTPVWGWVWFAGALLIGALATAWVALRTTDSASPADDGGAGHQGDNIIGSVRAADSGTAIGVNYGDVRSGPGSAS